MYKLDKELVLKYGYFMEGMVDGENATHDSILLITFMFKQIAGGKFLVHNEMCKCVESFYNYIVTYLVRPSKKQYVLPILLGSFDKPIFKYKKASLKYCNVNDGLHVHFLLAIPKKIKCKSQNIEFYINKFKSPPSGVLLSNIDVQTCDSNIEHATDYVFKNCNYIGSDAEYNIILYPKASSEL
jgi:hypothetical protein